MQCLEIEEMSIADSRWTSLPSTASFTNGFAHAMQKRVADSVSTSALCKMIDSEILMGQQWNFQDELRCQPKLQARVTIIFWVEVVN